MTFEYRQITDEELADWRKVVRRGFNEHAKPEEIERLRTDRIEYARAWAAFDDGEIIGTGGAESHVITVPGGAQVPMPGIAYIGTVPTHGRRGVLTRMMETLLEQSRELDEPILGLKASQSSIYERFGFGIATQMEFWQIEAARGKIVHTVESPGKVRFVKAHEALPAMKTVYEAHRTKQVGAMDRSDGIWRYNFPETQKADGDKNESFYLLYEDENGPEGYAVYRTSHPDDFDSDSVDITVEELVTTSDQAHAALLKFLLNIDLLRKLSVGRRAPDDPLWWMLADPRQLSRSPYDSLWLRLIDPAKALSARAYGVEGKLNIELRDSFWPDAEGTYEVDASEGESTCKGSNKAADLTLSASELGAIYLGGAKPSDLARAGRIEERRDGALALADSMFAVSPLPWTCHSF